MTKLAFVITLDKGSSFTSVLKHFLQAHNESQRLFDKTFLSCNRMIQHAVTFQCCQFVHVFVIQVTSLTHTKFTDWYISGTIGCQTLKYGKDSLSFKCTLVPLFVSVIRAAVMCMLPNLSNWVSWVNCKTKVKGYGEDQEGLSDGLNPK